jgi:hypothetical protein
MRTLSSSFITETSLGESSRFVTHTPEAVLVRSRMPVEQHPLLDTIQEGILAQRDRHQRNRHTIGHKLLELFGEGSGKAHTEFAILCRDQKVTKEFGKAALVPLFLDLEVDPCREQLTTITSLVHAARLATQQRTSEPELHYGDEQHDIPPYYTFGVDYFLND